MAKAQKVAVQVPQDIYKQIHGSLIDYIEQNFTEMSEAMDFLTHTVVTMKYNLDLHKIHPPQCAESCEQTKGIDA